MISRIIDKKLRSSPKSVLLLGPRQVGKSTVCRALNPAVIVNLADESEFQAHLKDPGLVSRIVNASARDAHVLIDEVQRVPSILNSIQALIDTAPERKFYITGSSARKLKRGKANLLPGRVFVERMGPLLFWELQDEFNLEHALRVGTLPEVYLKDYGERLLGSYVDTYLREEIQAEAVTRDLGAYARFLDLAAELNGQYINYAKISSDAEIKKETVRRYFSILEDTMLVERIPSYTDIKDSRRARQKDRFVFFDLGVRNALLKRHIQAPTKTELGHLFEQWIFLQVLNFSRLYDKPWKISSFAILDGPEVDLIIETPSELLALEIKYRSVLDNKTLRGLNEFEEVSGRKAQRFIIYTGMHRQRFDNGVEALPYSEFLSDLLPSL